MADIGVERDKSTHLPADDCDDGASDIASLSGHQALHRPLAAREDPSSGGSNLESSGRSVDDAAVAQYLVGIGVSRPAACDAAALRELHAAHLFAVPFENLSIHLGEPIALDDEQLFRKLVERHRGGFCYELNGAFSELLRSLGYEVVLLAARVFTGPQELGPPFDHLVLRVNTPEPWFADVGFGEHSLEPLRLEPGTQADPRGVFEIVEASATDLDVLRDGVPQYRVEMHARELADFRAMCWYQQHSPESHFTQALACSLATPSGRVTLSERTLITTAGNDRTETTFHDDAEILEAYRTVFGIELDRVPIVRNHEGHAKG
jgi:N-hydroxyarylamine O-acetyltransferase